jgi:hypothetical protein
MAEYLVELYLSRDNQAALESAERQACRAAEELTRGGTAVRYVRAIFVPDDETCFLLYQAASAEAVRKAMELAALPVDRIAETFDQLGEKACLNP